MHRLLTTALLLLVSGTAIAREPEMTRDQAQAFVQGLRFETGKVDLGSGLATLTLPEGFRYLGPRDSADVLVKLWGNPPGDPPLGMIFPADGGPLDPESWAVVVSWQSDGFVKDDDANDIDYGALLKEMQAAARESNPEREQQGYPPIQLMGWAEPPRYDAAGHKLYWARELAFGGEPEHTLNYDIRILGRNGVLVLSSVGSMAQLPEIRESGPQLLSMIDFNPGNRYVDFDPSTDKVASYGLAALIAGGIAGKLGFFKGLLAVLLAAKKLVIVAVLAVGVQLRKLFGRSPSPSETAITLPPSPPGAST